MTNHLTPIHGAWFTPDWRPCSGEFDQQFAIENGYSVRWFTLKNGGFPSFFVCLPEGILWVCTKGYPIFRQTHFGNPWKKWIYILYIYISASECMVHHSHNVSALLKLETHWWCLQMMDRHFRNASNMIWNSSLGLMLFYSVTLDSSKPVILNFGALKSPERWYLC